MSAAQASNPLDQIANQAALEAAKGEWQKSITSEVKAIAGKLDGIVKDYKAKHDGILDRWNLQGKEIARLRKSIVGIYEDWKKLIEAGVCPIRKNIDDYKQQVRQFKGTNEAARDKAKADLDRAKANLDGWQKVADQLTKQLGENDKQIEQIEKLVPGDDQVQSLYYFWFKLLPAYASMQPDESKSIYDGEMPKQLCQAKNDGKADPNGKAEAANQEAVPESTAGSAYSRGRTSPEGSQAEEPRPAPWLIDPDKLQATIIKAVEDYLKAGTDYAEAKATFDQEPDDPPGIRKRLEELQKNEEEKVKQQLKKQDPSAAPKAA